MPFTEDHSVFFVTTEFASAATFNGSDTVNGIFDDEFNEPFGEGEVMTTRPRFTCASADVSDPVGKTLLVNSTTYVIRQAHPDGTGQTVLELDEQ